MLVLLSIAVLVIATLQEAESSEIHVPQHFYIIDPNRSLRLDGDAAKVELGSGLPYIGSSKKTLWVSKNGVILFDETDLREPYKLPNGIAMIAPLRSWLSFGNNTGQVYYQHTTKAKILKQAKQDVQANFACATRFKPKTVLIVTWYNMPIDPCTEYAMQQKDSSWCSCIHRYTTDYCECRDYALADWCACHDPDGCKCDDLFTSTYYDELYNNWYCSCLNTEAKPVCDCFKGNMFYGLFVCRCLYEGKDYDYCNCMGKGWGPSEEYCTCLHIENRPWDECECVDRYGNSYCECISEYYELFGEYMYDKAYEFCDCFTDGKDLSSCLCPGMNSEYCDCLDQFQDHFDATNKTHFDLHEFCLCFSVSGNSSVCGCDSCPSRRELSSQSFEGEKINDKWRKRRSELGSDDGSVGPWSREHNTFQAVIITDYKKTFVMFNYESLNVPKYLDGENVDIHPAVVGFEGDDRKFFEHEYSFNKNLYRVMKKSNVGIKGSWMYRVDKRNVLEPADC